MAGVASVSAPVRTKDGTKMLMQVLPTTAPANEATSQLVTKMRDGEARIAGTTGVHYQVTGSTAVDVDVSSRLAAALPPYAAIVVGLSLILLLLVFRSIVVPLKATLGFTLSVGATFGAVVAVFQWGWLASALGVAQTGPIASFLPIMVIAVLFGLAMDYEVFLVSSIRESYLHHQQPDLAIVAGFGTTARVVTAAALIMSAVFGGFVSTDNNIIKPIAFSLTFGVAVDAFLIRMTFVPAVLALFGRRAWILPRWLDRLLCNLNIEGDTVLTFQHRRERKAAE
jgi:RND superfamily putative drug exporter